MLISLHIKNAFRHPDTKIDFQKGYTAIVGANESGKSMIFEMIGFSLFGTTALRGRAEDYKKLEATLVFVVGELTYRVARIQGKCELWSGPEGLICTGVKEVNKKIVEILGYSYEVFCMANYAAQGQVTRLSDMKPTERKKMVDNLIGLNILDDLTTVITGKMQRLRGMIEGEGPLGDYPEAPTEPQGWGSIKTEDLELGLAACLATQSRKAQLEASIQKIDLIPPAELNLLHEGEIPQWVNYTNLMAHTNLKHFRSQLISLLENPIQEPAYSLEQLNEMNTQWGPHLKWVEAQDKLANRVVQSPVYSEEELVKRDTLWDEYAEYLKQKALYDYHQFIECPSCQHQFKPDNMQEPVPVPKPELDSSQIQAHRNIAVKLEAEDRLYEQYSQVPEVAKPVLTPEEISQCLLIWDRITQRQLQIKSLEETIEATDVEGDGATIEHLYQCKEHDDKERVRFAHDQEKYQTNLKRYTEEFTELQTLSDQTTTIESLKQMIKDFSLYSSLLDNYNKSCDSWDQKQQRLTAYAGKLDQYERARGSMKALRSKVKKYLVPSLNKVASVLLAQMTGGERQTIEVDEDFDILVDGQPINTLSGSGKAVANLAIRIGLGQVLINKKFSVFMGDEIDGDMDAARAAHTSECLERLTQNISQLVLISHKRPEAQHYIEL